jgi:hypothetical protein
METIPNPVRLLLTLSELALGRVMVLSQWWTYDRSIVAYSPDELGVYELGDESRITVYYGSGKIRARLLDYLNKKECPMARYYRFELFITEEECRAKEQQLLDDYKRRHGILPMYNEKIGKVR